MAYNILYLLAESEGFEPPNGFPSPDFESGAFSHSASSPSRSFSSNHCRPSFAGRFLDPRLWRSTRGAVSASPLDPPLCLYKTPVQNSAQNFVQNSLQDSLYNDFRQTVLADPIYHNSLAERVGFEPTKRCRLHPFQPCAFDRPATSPSRYFIY